MDNQEITRQDGECRYVVSCNQTSEGVTKHILGRLAQTIIIFLVSVFIIGCDSGQPRYDVYPTLSINSRRDWSDKTQHWLFALWRKDSDSALCRWRDRFDSAVNMMLPCEWDPNTPLLHSTLDRVSEEYDSNLPKATLIPLAQEALLNGFKLDGNDPHENGIMGGIDRMCKLIDAEHPRLLIDGNSLILPTGTNPFNLFNSLPDMVSYDYPVDVCPTIWSQPSSKKEANETTIYLASGTVINSSKPPIIINGFSGSIPDQNEAARGKTSDKGEEKKKDVSEAEVCHIEDFNSIQHVSINISTALNSTSILDRVEYVSTYIFLQPYPFPPQGNIVLEREFWRGFFALNSVRDPCIQEKDITIKDDMMRAIEDMRVHIIDTDTDLKTIIDLGSLTRHTNEALNAALSGKVTPVPRLEIGPSLSYSSGVTTDMANKLQQQLDQRSVYVDSPGKFLRITQRGMQSVNLAGRFIENVTLSIPAAQEQVPVLAMVHDSNNNVHYEKKLLSMPLYSRVDAFTVSVVIARRATALAKSTKESFRLDDPKDAAFIAGITRPYRMTLWQYEREMEIITTNEISGKKDYRTATFAFHKEPNSPLILCDFTTEMRSKLLDEIRKQMELYSDSCDISYQPPCLRDPCDPCDPNKITIYIKGKK